MADHLSDEEQLEALKKWWKENGTSLLMSIVLVTGGWFGWNFWQDKQEHEKQQASVVYMAMIEGVAIWEQDKNEKSAAFVAAQAETLKKLAKDGRYSHYASLALARLSSAEGDYDNATAELQAVINGSDDEGLKSLATLRLAILESGRGNTQQALTLLSGQHAESFRSLYQELKGDIYSAEEDKPQALTAYQSALDNLNDSDSRARALLELKINEVRSDSSTAMESGEDA